ncbi:hypothetical protein ACFVRH_42950, partial [Streptomyces sp. NPDC057909]
IPVGGQPTPDNQDTNTSDKSGVNEPAPKWDNSCPDTNPDCHNTNRTPTATNTTVQTTDTTEYSGWSGDVCFANTCTKINIPDDAPTQPSTPTTTTPTAPAPVPSYGNPGRLVTVAVGIIAAAGGAILSGVEGSFGVMIEETIKAVESLPVAAPPVLIAPGAATVAENTAFLEKEYANVSLNESVGGNAGEMSVAVNGVADLETGKILYVGNKAPTGVDTLMKNGSAGRFTITEKYNFDRTTFSMRPSDFSVGIYRTNSPAFNFSNNAIEAINKTVVDFGRIRNNSYKR